MTTDRRSEYDDDDDIYIMMQCVFVKKNDHFLLGVSCNHPGLFFMVLGWFLWFFILGQVLGSRSVFYLFYGHSGFKGDISRFQVSFHGFSWF